MEKTYLGDSVYIDFDERTCMVRLTTENGYPDAPSNEIWLEEPVAINMLRWFEALQAEARAEQGCG